MDLKERRLLELLDRRSIEHTVAPGACVLVAVSGGADSVALVRALNLYAPARALKLAVVHVNHGLRQESDSEAQFVIELCEALGLKLYHEKLSLGEKPKGMSPEEYWRHERYKVFSRVRVQANADFVALGQTADDLAESFLYHLTRGTGPEGLVFQFLKYAQPDNIPVVRPLWKTRRCNIEAALNGVEQQWITDPTNQDIKYSRNRIRKEVIPALEQINPAAVEAIVSLADKLSARIEVTTTATHHKLVVLEISPTFRESSFSALCSAVRELFTDTDLMHTAKHVEHAAEMIRDGSSGIVALPNFKSLIITQNNAWVYEGSDPDNLALAKEHIRRFGGFAADLSATHHHGHEPLKAMALDGNCYEILVSSQTPVIIRNRQTGDRIGPRTVKKLLIDFQIPWYLRDYLVLAATSDRQVIALIAETESLITWVLRHTASPATLYYSKVDPTA